MDSQRDEVGGAESGGRKPASSLGLDTCIQHMHTAPVPMRGLWAFERTMSEPGGWGAHLSKSEATEREIPRATIKDQGERHGSYAMA